MREKLVTLDETEIAYIVSALQNDQPNMDETQKLITKIKNAPSYNTIPESIKEDNWRLYEQAMNPDPAMGPQYGVKLCNHLKVTMILAGITEFDDVIEDALKLSKISLANYSSDIDKAGHEGEALQNVSDAMEMVGHIIYDPLDRFTKRNINAFTGR